MKSGLKLLLCIGMLPLAMTVAAQSSSDKESFDDAEYFFAQEDYQEALTSYSKLVKRNFKDNANINYKIGICYIYSSTERDKAVSFLEKAVKKVSDKYQEGSIKELSAPQDAYLWLGNAYRINMQLDKAIDAYGKFITLTSNKKDKDAEADRNFAKEQILACKKAKQVSENPVKIKTISLGKPINTVNANYNPAISSNEQYLVYISKQRFYDALMFSKFTKGKWSTPDNITPEIASDGDQLPVFLSNDGTTLLLAKQDANNSDIYISKYDGKAWSQSQPLNKEINTKYWESHACISPDGKTLYFTSNRQQSLGGEDIFYSELKPDGQWGTPINLGSTINTTSNEETPFISANGNTLYFSSQAHGSIGGFDIFYSTRDESGKWSEPVAMPFPINTTDDDLFFVPTDKKYYAYQSKYLKNGVGDLDIVRLEIFSNEHPFIYEIKGNVADLLKGVRNEKFETQLHVINNHADDSLRQNTNGNFTFNKPSGNYNISFKKDDFVVESKPFEIPANYKEETYLLTSDLLGISDKYVEYLAMKEKATSEPQKAVSKVVEPEKEKKAATSTANQKPATLHNILFSFNESELTKEADNEIANIVLVLNENPSLVIEVIGHTDSKGNSLYNNYLSEKRAKIVKKKIEALGIKAIRIKTDGKGESEPIALNENTDGSDNPEGRAYNRRVEFKVVKSENKNITIAAIQVPEKFKIKAGK